ncbi:hypothetical protein D3C75_1243470 [compost metagenome]
MTVIQRTRTCKKINIFFLKTQRKIVNDPRAQDPDCRGPGGHVRCGRAQGEPDPGGRKRADAEAGGRTGV